MRLRFYVRTTAVVLCSVLAFLLLAHSPAFADALSDAARKNDPRLEKRVTLITPQGCYVGELLEMLSAQTGVELSASDTDGAAGQHVVVRLQDIPLGDVMNALWSLYIYRNAEWDWKVVPAATSAKSATPAAPTYLLSRPRAAQMLGRKIRDQIQQEFEDEADALMAAVKPGAEPSLGDGGTVAEKLKDKMTRSGVETLAETLSPEQRLRVLRGEEELKIPVTQLGEKAKAFVDRGWQMVRKANPTLQAPGYSTPPTFIRLEARNGTSVTPFFFIELEGSGGISYIGGRASEEKWRKNLKDLWMHEGDVTTDTREALTVIAPKNTPGGTIEKPLPWRAPTPALWQIAEAASIPFLCRAPASGLSDRGAPYNLTVQKALENKLNPMRYKWRSGLLLLSDPSWFYTQGHKESRFPYLAFKRLRQAEASAGDEMLPFAELLRTASELKPEELKAMENYFPVLRHVAVWRDWFVWMNRNPDLVARLQTPEGMPRREMPAVLRAVLPAEVDAGKIVAVRLKIVDKRWENTKEPYRSVGFEMLDAGGKPLAHSGFIYQGPRRTPVRFR